MPPSRSIQAQRHPFLLRVTPALHRRLLECARIRGESLNRYCEDALAATVAGSSTQRNDWNELARAFGGSLLGVVLFGSHARGNARSDSDLDLLLVVDDGLTLGRALYRIAEDALSIGDASIHIVHMPRLDEDCGSLWLEIAIDGKILHDPSGRLQATLVQLRGRVASGEFRRSVVHGQGYWKKNAE